MLNRSFLCMNARNLWYGGYNESEEVRTVANSVTRNG